MYLMLKNSSIRTLRNFSLDSMQEIKQIKMQVVWTAQIKYDDYMQR